MSEEIILNGKRYRNPSEMPPEIRQLYGRLERLFEDQDHDGVPDLFEQGGLAGLGNAFDTIKDIASLARSGQISSDGQLSLIKISDYGITVNGKHFRSEDEIPAPLHDLYQQAVRTAQDGGEELYANELPPAKHQRYLGLQEHDAVQDPAPVSAPIEVENSNRRFLFLLIAIVLLISILGIALWISNLNF